MSTVAKGTEFERKVFAYLRREIEARRYWANPECTKVYWHKDYYSQDRKAMITFDVTIEVFMPGCDTYSVLVVVECKNYENSVAIGDIEQLESRMQQVSSGNTKGILFTSSPLQSAALNFAASKGIAIVRQLPNKRFKWELQRETAAWGRRFGTMGAFAVVNELTAAESETEIGQAPHRFACVAGERATHSPLELLDWMAREVLGDQLDTPLALDPQTELVPYRHERELAAKAAEVLRGIGYDTGAAPLHEIAARIPGYNLEQRQPTQGESMRRLLGSINFERRTITIFDLGLDRLRQQRFTLAHELGHYFLGHGEYLRSEECDASDWAQDNQDLEASIAGSALRRLEIQANCFASHLVLPQAQFMGDVARLVAEFGLRDKGHGYFYLDGQPCNMRDYHRALARLQQRYNISRRVIKNRLQSLGVLSEKRAPSISSPLNDDY